MCEKLFIFDTTLRDGEQVPGCQFEHHREDRGRQARSKVSAWTSSKRDFPISSPGDFNSVLEISKAVSAPTICALTRAVKKDIDVGRRRAAAGQAQAHPHRDRRIAPAYLRQAATRHPKRSSNRAVEAVKYAKQLRRGRRVLRRRRRARRSGIPRARGRSGHRGRRDGGQHSRHHGLLPARASTARRSSTSSITCPTSTGRSSRPTATTTWAWLRPTR